MDDKYRFAVAPVRPFLIKVKSEDLYTEEQTSISILTFFASNGFYDKIGIEVLENYDILVKCDFLLIERIKYNFGSLVEIKEIIDLGGSTKH